MIPSVDPCEWQDGYRFRRQAYPPDPGQNATINYRKQKRSNATHASKTEPATRLYKKTNGAEAKLCHLGHIMTENRNGLVVNSRLILVTGTAEREARQIHRHIGRMRRDRFPVPPGCVELPAGWARRVERHGGCG